MNKKRASLDDLEKLVRQAIDNMKVLPQYKGKQKLPINAVAKEAGISRGNFYLNKDEPLDSKVNIVRARLKALAYGLEPDRDLRPSIQSIKPKNASARELEKLISQHTVYEKTLDDLEHAFETVTKKIMSNYMLLNAQLHYKKEKNNDSSSLRKLLIKEREDNKDLNDKLNKLLLKESSPIQVDKQNKKVSLIRSKRSFSPDENLMVGGKYIWSEIRSAAAWHKAIEDFRIYIKENRPATVYLMAGPPCSGKTYWVTNHQPSTQNLNVYFDATLSNIRDRAHLALTIREECEITKIVCVRTVAGLDECILRQSKRNRRPNEKFIHESKIRKFHGEFIEVSASEPFDQIMIIKSKDNA